MNKKTIEAIIKARKVFGNRHFTLADWDDSIDVRIETAIKHGAVKKLVLIRKNYVTLQELVDLLNGCAGEDCYGTSWCYKIDENGNVYDEVQEVTYCMVQA